MPTAQDMMDEFYAAQAAKEEAAKKPKKAAKKPTHKQVTDLNGDGKIDLEDAMIKFS